RRLLPRRDRDGQAQPGQGARGAPDAAEGAEPVLVRRGRARAGLRRLARGARVPARPAPVTGDVARLRADNPSPYTLDGTNTWVVGRDPAWIVDPGPALDAHLEA